MFYFYIPEGLSGVTKFYVLTIADAITSIGHEYVFEKELKKIPPEANVITITDKAATMVSLFRKPKLLINWYQGISPEEMKIIYDGKLAKWPRFMIRKSMVAHSIKQCDLNIFVSEAMLEHHRKKYGYEGNNYFIMPCFGNNLSEHAFNDNRYTSPSFLYSGTAVRWQCMEEMLDLFKLIKAEIPAATLTILTPDREIAQELITRKEVEASLGFVKPDELQEFISRFKYGFIVRDDIDVNRVATPTKMSNYMGAGIIPVYSDVVRDYQKHITGKSPYLIPFTTNDECIEKIKQMEAHPIKSDDIKASYKDIFYNYWNRDLYINQIALKLKELL